MIETIANDTAHTVSRSLELIGIAVIAVGAAATLAIFLYRAARREELVAAFASFRSSFGRAILLGLEFLIAADIINTLESVAVLAGIVAIRTFLSFSLELEIEGRWPWQRGSRKRGA
jgi:uncharacterized membrane protein